MNKYVREQYTSLPHGSSVDPTAANSARKRRTSLMLAELHKMREVFRRKRAIILNQSLQECGRKVNEIRVASEKVKKRSANTWKKALQASLNATDISGVKSALTMANTAVQLRIQVESTWGRNQASLSYH